ncbi:MAG: NADH-quinone oxidoreductase subunit N [Nocardioidaceae bacterium]
MTTQPIDWWAIAPPLCLVTAAILALLVDAFAPRAWRALPCALSVAGVTAALLSSAALTSHSRLAFCLPAGFEQPVNCSWLVDEVTLVWWLIVLISTGFIALLLQPSVDRGELPAGELYFLLLSSATGALCLAAARDLITLVVALETLSLPSFALVGLRRGNRRGAEGALKFFLVSVVATAFTLLGISMVYGATGSVAAGRVASSLATGAAVEPVVGVGMVLTVVGFGFKVAVVPFQVWVPDTYVGAPIGVAAYLSVVSKAAGLAGLVIVLVRFFPPYVDLWSPVVAAAAALTMTLGNLAALRQRHVVRLLAWSSVAQAGYLLVPLAAGGSDTDIGAMQAYALMYAVVNVTAFAVVSAVSAWGAVNVDDFAGLVRTRPWLGLALAFALLCLAGLPPGIVGLVAKVSVFRSAVDGNLTWLAVVMAINVALGLVYYLRFIAALVSPAPAATENTRLQADRPSGSAVDFVVIVTFLVAGVLSIFPGPLFFMLP